MKLYLMLVLTLVPLGFAAQAVQTDWSGGPAVSGAVSEWNSEFSSADGAAWCSIPGQVQLSSTPLTSSVEHMVFTGVANPYAADVADLNNDGFNDLVAGSGDNDGVIAYYGSPDGQWLSQVVSENCPGAIGLKIDDFNGDGLLDIAACADTEMQVCYNLGGTLPSWNVTVAGSGYVSLHEVESVDMDEDGDMDLLGADYDGDHLFWLRNQGGSPVAWDQFSIDAAVDYPCKIHAVDINGDGNMDVAVAAWLDDKVIAYYGSGGSEPEWTAQELDSSIDGAHGVRACDIDSDGDMDVIGASINSSALYLYRNQGGTLPSWVREPLGTIAGAAIVRVGDFDGDGDPDVTSSSFGNGGVAWWENTENGTVFLKHLIKPGGQATSWAMPGDIDNDGDLDVLAVRYQQNSMYWYEVTEFLPSGSIDSNVLDTGESPQWASFDWDSETPSGCSVSFQFRTSEDYASMGNWSTEYQSPSVLSGLVQRYFQYRLILNSSSPEESPIVREVQLNWDAQGISENTTASFLSVPNPCRGQLSITVAENLPGPAEVNLFSAEGRLLLSREVAGGETLLPSGLPPGLYFLSGGSGSAESTSFVLLPR